MKQSVLKFVILVLMLIPISTRGTMAYAADGSSGCGPAWYILKENSLLSSAGRFVTNWFLFPISTLGMVFGTSNCAQHKLVDIYRPSLEFASKSFDILRHDIVRGEGVHFSSYLGTFGCHSGIRNEIAGKLRGALARDHKGLNNPAQLVLTSITVIRDEPYYAMQCV